MQINEVTPSADIVSRVNRCCVQMLFKHPFYSYILMNLERVAVTGDEIPRMAINTKYMYYNVDFVKSMNDDELMFAFGAEVLKVVYDVFNRRNGRDKDNWALSSEFAANADLIETKVGQKPRSEIMRVAHDDKYRGLGAYQIFEELEKDPRTKSSNKGQGGKGQGGSNKPGNVNGYDLMDAGLDYDPNESMITEDKIINAAKTAGTESLPPSLRSIVNEFLNPKISWRKVLHTDIRSLNTEDYTLIKPNRKSWQLGVILPGTIGFNRLELGVAIDVSGSVSEEAVRDMLTEVKSITDNFKDFEIRIWLFDTGIYNVQTFTPANIDELDNYRIEGGGGTSLDINWKYMEKEMYVPHRFIIFTDGYCGDDAYRRREDYCDTIFVIFDNERYNAPFGLHLNYDAEI